MDVSSNIAAFLVRGLATGGDTDVALLVPATGDFLFLTDFSFAKDSSVSESSASAVSSSEKSTADFRFRGLLVRTFLGAFFGVLKSIFPSSLQPAAFNAVSNIFRHLL